jgi:hypothetical protein
MRKERALYRDLDRLIAASTMFAAQELERTMLGDDEDNDDARHETHEVVSDVLDTIEKSLDEDLLERVERGEYPRVAHVLECWPQALNWRQVWPYTYGYGWYRGPIHSTKTLQRGKTDMLDQILDDFREDFEARLKTARREERSLTDAELEEAVNELKEDLKVIARRTRRREERREEEHDTKRRTKTRKE